MDKTIYLAGASAEAAMIASYATALAQSGWTIAHAWWNDFLVGGHTPGMDRDVSHEIRAMHAHDDFEGALSANYFWLLVPGATGSVGAWIEYGAAIGYQEPVVIVSGDWRRTIFTELADDRFATHGLAMTWFLEQ